MVISVDHDNSRQWDMTSHEQFLAIHNMHAHTLQKGVGTHNYRVHTLAILIKDMAWGETHIPGCHSQ